MMNRLTAEINRKAAGLPKPRRLDWADPCQVVLHENRRLELIAEFQPKRPMIKLRKRS